MKVFLLCISVGRRERRFKQTVVAREECAPVAGADQRGTGSGASGIAREGRRVATRISGTPATLYESNCKYFIVSRLKLSLQWQLIIAC